MVVVAVIMLTNWIWVKVAYDWTFESRSLDANGVEGVTKHTYPLEMQVALCVFNGTIIAIPVVIGFCVLARLFQKQRKRERPN